MLLNVFFTFEIKFTLVLIILLERNYFPKASGDSKGN